MARGCGGGAPGGVRPGARAAGSGPPVESRPDASQLEEKKVELEVTHECRVWLARKGFSSEFGARNIARLVQDKIKTYFVDAVLFGELSEGGKAVADLEDDEVVVRPAKKKRGRKKSLRRLE